MGKLQALYVCINGKLNTTYNLYMITVYYIYSGTLYHWKIDKLTDRPKTKVDHKQVNGS